MTLLRLLRSYRCAWLVVVAPLGLGGCASKDVGVMNPVQHAPSFSTSGEAPLPHRWWTAFNDPALNDQIEICFDGNFTLASAWQRLHAAEALTRREASDLLPDVNGFAEAEGVFRNAAEDDSLFALGVGAGYQLDLWGEIGARVQAERLRTSATMADYHSAALALAADFAATWFSLVEARAQLALLGEQLETNLTGLDLQEKAFGVGQAFSPDVLRQRQLVEATREQVVVVQSRVELLEHQLALLQGRAPQNASYAPEAVLPTLPPLPKTGLPAELVHRRPDVRRAFFALAAADHDLASAVSAQYPRLNLTGSVVTVAENPTNLFRDFLATIAAQFIGPLFDGGQRRAEVDRNAAVVRELINEYGQTILAAFQEVEDALAFERYQLQRIEHLNAQLELARESSERLHDLYFLTDEADFLDLLNATTDTQRLQRAILSARLELIQNRISLYLALAGDFETHPPEIGGGLPPEHVSDEAPPEIDPAPRPPHVSDE
ncbi:MAG: TolC family protein [Planctomycetes bacterium]|nr:TolC family protein [Planctomycetota bacterium]